MRLHPDDRPPGRGHPIVLYLDDATGAVDPATAAREEAEFYLRQAERHGRSVQSHQMKERACREFARVWFELAEASDRKRFGRAA